MTAEYIKSVVKTVPDYPKPGILFRDVTSVLEDHKAFSSCIFPVRKPNKLPREVVSESYELEYGMDTLEIHKDAIEPGDKVLLIDDLLATGGTIAASAKLIRSLGGEVNHAGFVINLPDLGGKEKLSTLDIESYSICEFEGE